MSPLDIGTMMSACGPDVSSSIEAIMLSLNVTDE
jgi:hypothetical protein